MSMCHCQECEDVQTQNANVFASRRYRRIPRYTAVTCTTVLNLRTYVYGPSSFCVSPARGKGVGAKDHWGLPMAIRRLFKVSLFVFLK